MCSTSSRLKQTVATKDALIRDLKTKLETIEGAAADVIVSVDAYDDFTKCTMHKVGLAEGDATGGDYASMSNAELKNRFCRLLQWLSR
jgi:hypothetical protein